MIATETTTTLQHLLDLLREGDDSAREALLEHGLDRFRVMARRMFRQQHDLRKLNETDDVLQKALLRLYAVLERVKPLDVLSFYGLAARQIRWVLRDLAREILKSKNLTFTDMPPDLEDKEGEPLDLMAWADFHRKIDGLPREEQEMFDLLFYEGLTQSEAAEVLQRSVRTIKRRWQKARLLLARVLHNDWPGVC